LTPWFVAAYRLAVVCAAIISNIMHGRFGRTFARALLLALVLAIFAPGRGAAAAETPPAKRWLLVLETSSTMQRRKEGTLQAIDSLLASKMDGQLRPGDTIGVWTFNSQLFAGQFPLKRWSAESAGSIRSEILEFAGGQPFARQPDIAQVLSALSKVVSNSPVITVLIFGSGEGTVAGTPFDNAINETWATWKAPQQKARMPILTILRGVDGRVSSHIVSPAQYSVELPPLPEPPPPVVSLPPPTEPSKPAQPAPPPAAEKPEAPRPKAPPLIISGKKEKTEAVAAELTNVVSGVVSQPPGTNLVPQSAAPVPAITTNDLKPATVTNAPAFPVALTNDAPKVASAEKAKPALPESRLENPKPVVPAPAVTGTALPVGKGEVQNERHAKWIWIAGLGMVAVFLVAGYLVRRPGRRSAHTSLITESLDRDDPK